MRKNLLGLLLLAMIVLVACAAKKNKTSAADPVYLKMLRSPCFGKCPNYTVEIYKDGLVRYTGIRFTEKTGKYEKNIGAAKAQDLLHQFGKARVDTCQTEYFMKISDLPGINYTLDYNGKKVKEIRNAHFGPPLLKELAKEVDKVAVVDATWRKTSESAGEE